VQFAGRRLKQMSDYSFRIDMNEFCRDRLDTVKLKKRRRPKGQQTEIVELTVEAKGAMAMRTSLPSGVSWEQGRRRTTVDSKTGEILEEMLAHAGQSLDTRHAELPEATDLLIKRRIERDLDEDQRELDSEEQTQLRAVIAGLNWASREGRPDAAAAASIYARELPSPTPMVAKGVNSYVEYLKANPLEITIHAIPEEMIRKVTISDSAFDTTGQERSQHGWIFGFSTPELHQGQ
jgi:hypothetical protein